MKLSLYSNKSNSNIIIDCDNEVFSNAETLSWNDSFKSGDWWNDYSSGWVNYNSGWNNVWNNGGY